MMCTPSRSALQTGRLPVHVITQLADPCDENGAIPRNMTGLAAKLKLAGYSTHQVGKWDAGMTTPTHTPHGRGYDTSLSYFGHGNWAWTEQEWQGSFDHRTSVPEYGVVDFWDTDHPARHLNGTGYEELLFRERMLSILHTHDRSMPLFLNYDSKIAHYPLQAPRAYQERFAFIADPNRRTYAAMIAFLDDQLANITGTMRELNMWDNTLMILTSDNGGFVLNPDGPCNITEPPSGQPPPLDSNLGHGTACFNGEAGASNYPLRGGKYSMFEGGIRVNAFVSGGYIPPSVRGTKLDGIVHVADWYSTLCSLAGVDPTDDWAAASGLPPIDSINVWPMLSGATAESPREHFLVLPSLLVSGRWKYVQGNTTMHGAAWGGERYPNASTATDPIFDHTIICPPRGCLFDVVSDPHEYHEVSADHPQVVTTMQALMEREAATVWSQPHTQDPMCRQVAKDHYGNFLGPFREI
jgi:arylsulfatase A-like enzyme